ncbi:hypothetical protein MTO96_043633, partial [Rhipicephalus appendiculatus]
CAGEVVSNIESTISKDPLLKFLSTTGQRLKTIQVELDAINSSMNGPKLSGVLAKTGRASTALREASTLSKGTMPQLKDTADQLDFSSQLAMPQPVKDLQDKMKRGDLQSELSKIPTPENLDKEVKGLMGGVGQGVDDYRAQMKKALQDMRRELSKEIGSTQKSLNTFEEQVKQVADSDIRWYDVALGFLLFVMIVIVGQYIVGELLHAPRCTRDLY